MVILTIVMLENPLKIVIFQFVMLEMVGDL